MTSTTLRRAGIFAASAFGLFLLWPKARAEAMVVLEELIEKAINAIMDTNADTKKTAIKLEEVYPASTKKSIKLAFARPGTLPEKWQAAQQEFTLEGDTDAFVRGVFGSGERVGKETWQALFGAPPRSYRTDIDELMDVTGVLGVGVVTSRVRESSTQDKFWSDLQDATRSGGDDQSAGLAERHMAIGMAGLGGEFSAQGEILTSDLALRNLRHQDRQFRRRLALGSALSVYEAFGGREGVR